MIRFTNSAKPPNLTTTGDTMILKFTKVKHPHKRGYTLRPNQPLGYLPFGYMGWYKLKAVATERAARLNADYQNREYTPA